MIKMDLRHKSRTVEVETATNWACLNQLSLYDKKDRNPGKLEHFDYNLASVSVKV